MLSPPSLSLRQCFNNCGHIPMRAVLWNFVNYFAAQRAHTFWKQASCGLPRKHRILDSIKQTFCPDVHIFTPVYQNTLLNAHGTVICFARWLSATHWFITNVNTSFFLIHYTRNKLVSLIWHSPLVNWACFSPFAHKIRITEQICIQPFWLTCHM